MKLGDYYFGCISKKDGEINEYSGFFETYEEAQQWYEIHGKWLENKFDRDLVICVVDEKFLENYVMKEILVLITVFNAVASQTDDTPLITASGYNITDPDKDKIIAVSRDLLEQFPFGTEVYVKMDGPYEGYYTVQDVMNERYNNTIDILIKEDDPIGKWEGSIIKYDAVFVD